MESRSTTRPGEVKQQIDLLEPCESQTAQQAGQAIEAGKQAQVMTDFVDKYFEHREMYPRGVTDDLLPPGTLYEYISSTFLNGLINYVEIQSAWLMARYQQWQGTGDGSTQTIQVMDPPGSYKWKKIEGNKQERFELLTTENAVCHSKLHDFGDDIVLLAKSELGKYFYLFWFDCDVSDCEVGRFSARGLVEQEVVKDFDDWCRELMEGDLDPSEENKPIPLHYFSEWISF